ncbi:MAG: LysM peptidoglycan-binding domain-containing protein [Firmicutes bacterium]|nr:LysM peptidoglycan-binding domain-containing protein [Bacillota bacterium]
MGKRQPTKNKEQNEFKFPANIKQMGNIDKEIKIYIEDYVYTYLYQFAKFGGGEKLAVLIGKFFEVEGTKVVMISGAVEGVATEYNDDDICFTEDSWNYIVSQKEKYFKELTVVGWVHVQPDFGTSLITRDLAFHRRCFEEIWQLLFVIDPVERSDAFYCYEKNLTDMRQSRGYFIYYEKNEDMQNYIIENGIIKQTETPQEKPTGLMSSGKMAVQRLIEITERARIRALRKQVSTERPDAAEKIREILKQKDERRRRAIFERKVATAVGCGILCFLFVFMISGLFSNSGRIQKLEREIADVRVSYDDMREFMDDTAKQVFAVKKENEAKKTDEVYNEVKDDETQEQMRDKNVSIKDETETENQRPIAENDYFIYYVEAGDNLLYISKQFYGNDEGVYDIIEANGLNAEGFIYSGQRLIIPKDIGGN